MKFFIITATKCRSVLVNAVEILFLFGLVILENLFPWQAVSCDEAFLDVSESKVGDPQLLASTIRKEIFNTTGCTASAGIAENMLMARLATKTAKPDGQCYISPEKVQV